MMLCLRTPRPAAAAAAASGGQQGSTGRADRPQEVMQHGVEVRRCPTVAHAVC
jgi:hypothetical protein